MRSVSLMVRCCGWNFSEIASTVCEYNRLQIDRGQCKRAGEMSGANNTGKKGDRHAGELCAHCAHVYDVRSLCVCGIAIDRE